MGNSLSGASNYVDRLPLGDSSEILLCKTKSSNGRQVTAEYSIGRENCKLSFTKIQHQEEEVTISIHDHAPTKANDDVELKMDVTIVEGLLLEITTLDGPSTMKQLPMCKTPTSQGGVLKSYSFLYGSDTDRKGLLVILKAKNCDDDKENPYLIIVKHYFFSASSSHGAYVVAKICSDSDGRGLSFQLEKPVQQPRPYLLALFNDVTAKGWTLNPNNSDFATDLPNQNKSTVITGQQKISSLVSTSGNTTGHYNGSIICDIM